MPFHLVQQLRVLYIYIYGYPSMYMAILPDGRFLAVKRIVDSQQFEEQIVSELKTLGTLRHKNLLPLFGFCVKSNTRLLVYKYLSNGNLFDWIHSVKHRRKTLQWPLRLKIAVGVARGLARLHHGCIGQVVHASQHKLKVYFA